MMKKIELRIMGGLGNQLYQYAAAKYFQNKYSSPKIIIDVGAYKTYKIRNLEIDRLLHNPNVLFVHKRHFFTSIVREGYHIYQKIYRIIVKKRPPAILIKIKENKYLCAYIECDYTKDYNCDHLHLYGYFVSAKIALEIRSQLMSEIWLDDEHKSQTYMKYYNTLKKTKCIGVSVRCGNDYVINQWPVCTKEYYQRGIEYILSNRPYSPYNILVFADDINKVIREGWFDAFSNVVYIENLSAYESFDLFRNCTDYVCSNSSFSWWGAFLTRSNDSIIINPNKVYPGNSTEVDKLTFYDKMIILNYTTGELYSSTE